MNGHEFGRRNNNLSKLMSSVVELDLPATHLLALSLSVSLTLYSRFVVCNNCIQKKRQGKRKDRHNE